MSYNSEKKRISAAGLEHIFFTQLRPKREVFNVQQDLELVNQIGKDLIKIPGYINLGFEVLAMHDELLLTSKSQEYLLDPEDREGIAEAEKQTKKQRDEYYDAKLFFSMRITHILNHIDELCRTYPHQIAHKNNQRLISIILHVFCARCKHAQGKEYEELLLSSIENIRTSLLSYKNLDRLKEIDFHLVFTECAKILEKIDEQKLRMIQLHEEQQRVLEKRRRKSEIARITTELIAVFQTPPASSTKTE